MPYPKIFISSRIFISYRKGFTSVFCDQQIFGFVVLSGTSYKSSGVLPIVLESSVKFDQMNRGVIMKTQSSMAIFNLTGFLAIASVFATAIINTISFIRLTRRPFLFDSAPIFLIVVNYFNFFSVWKSGCFPAQTNPPLSELILRALNQFTTFTNILNIAMKFDFFIKFKGE